MSAPVFEYFLEIPGTDDTANPIYNCLEYPPLKKPKDIFSAKNTSNLKHESKDMKILSKNMRRNKKKLRDISYNNANQATSAVWVNQFNFEIQH